MNSDLILICAFRYALGRATYVVAEVAREIQHRCHELSENDRELIIREIDEALRVGQAGMDMDRWQWEETRNVLVKMRVAA